MFVDASIFPSFLPPFPRLIHSLLLSSPFRILNFFYKNIIGVGVLFFFQIYCAWSSTYVFEYVYLLLWNVVWSLAPVIAM